MVAFADVRSEDVRLLRSLRGSPLTVLAGIFLFHGGPVGVKTLASATGYTRVTVGKALKELEFEGLVAQSGRYDAWLSTDKAKQLPLFPLQLSTHVENFDSDSCMGEVQNLYLAACSSSSLNSSSSNQKPLPPENENEAQNLYLAGLGEQERRIVELLVDDKGSPEVAQQMLAVAVSRGMSLDEIEAEVEAGLDYCHSREGRGICWPGAWVARRIEQGFFPWSAVVTVDGPSDSWAAFIRGGGDE